MSARRSIRSRATAGSPWSSRSARLSDGRRGGRGGRWTGSAAADQAPLVAAPDWRILATLAVALMILLSLGLVLLDTAPGHRWLVDRIGQVETATGLRIRIGRIEGSIFSESRLQQCPGPRPARRIPDISVDHRRLEADRLADQQPQGRTAGSRPAAHRALAQAQADRPHRADPAQVRHLHRQARSPAAGTGAGGYRQGTGRAPVGQRGHPFRARQGQTRRGAGRRRPAAGQPRRRARRQQVRHRCPCECADGTACCRRCSARSGRWTWSIDGDGSWRAWRGRAAAGPVGPADGPAGAGRRQWPLPAWPASWRRRRSSRDGCSG